MDTVDTVDSGRCISQTEKEIFFIILLQRELHR